MAKAKINQSDFEEFADMIRSRIPGSEIAKAYGVASSTVHYTKQKLIAQGIDLTPYVDIPESYVTAEEEEGYYKGVDLPSEDEETPPAIPDKELPAVFPPNYGKIEELVMASKITNGEARECETINDQYLFNGRNAEQWATRYSSLVEQLAKQGRIRVELINQYEE